MSDGIIKAPTFRDGDAISFLSKWTVTGYVTDELRGEVDRLKDENVRLRAALRELVDQSAFALFGDGEDCFDVAWNSARALVGEEG